MLSDLVAFGDWAVKSFVSMWNEIGTWGIIGGFIISAGLFRKVVLLLKNLWKGGI